jgi:hypothetical protein
MIEAVEQPAMALTSDVMRGEHAGTIKVDVWLDRVYTQDYKCFDFVREVWLASYGEDVGDKLQGFLAGVSDRRVKLSDAKRVTILEQPESPCFVLLQRKGAKTPPHIGIWFDGAVLHLGATGAQYFPLPVVARQYQKVTLFK